ncbi:MAG: histidine triad nucleotide-binding protein [Candidatus Tantalella remota]|nr:histidine triad nucleotide-binding protein [Candidatus Tantalella remota]
MTDDCLFCDIAGGKISADIVYQDDELVAFKDINPQAPVHILLIPREHIGTLNDVSGENEALAGKLLVKAGELARTEGLSEKGYRVVLNCGRDAGQEVFHIHAHILGGRKFAWPPG